MFSFILYTDNKNSTDFTTSLIYIHYLQTLYQELFPHNLGCYHSVKILSNYKNVAISPLTVEKEVWPQSGHIKLVLLNEPLLGLPNATISHRQIMTLIII